jgi:hypothetical protein
VAGNGFEVFLLALGTRADTEIRADQAGRIHAVTDTGAGPLFAGIGEYGTDVVERRGVALTYQLQQLAEELRYEAGVFVVSDDGHMGPPVDDPHLLGILQVFAEFTILTQKLEGFFLIL